MARQAYHACQESGALPASQKVVQHRWAEVTLFQLLGQKVAVLCSSGFWGGIQDFQIGPFFGSFMRQQW